MSNRNHLQPNINPTVNPVFKGNLSVDGNITNTGNIVSDGNIDADGNLSISGSSNVNDLTATGNIILPETTTVNGNSPNLITFGGVINDLDVVGAIHYFSYPIGGSIIRISACIQSPIGPGDAILISYINNVQIGNGVLTFPFGGSVEGQQAYTQPITDNILTDPPIDIVSVMIDGTNAVPTSAKITFTIAY